MDKSKESDFIKKFTELFINTKQKKYIFLNSNTPPNSPINNSK